MTEVTFPSSTFNKQFLCFLPVSFPFWNPALLFLWAAQLYGRAVRVLLDLQFSKQVILKLS